MTDPLYDGEIQEVAVFLKRIQTNGFLRLDFLDRATTTMDFRCKMTQFLVNLNDATTGHKLQGISKDVVIVTSWSK